MGRFISSDIAVSTGQGLTGNNTYAYCGNNPVVRIDEGGTAWETVWDLLSLGASIVDVAMNPKDPWAWIGLAGDLIDVAIPFVGGIGEATRAINAATEVIDAVDDIHDAGRAAERIDDATDAYKAMSGGLCFVAGTSVLSRDGEVAIESIRTGDIVWAWDETTDTVALKEVVETYVNETDELIHVFVNGEAIVATPGHPFYSPVKGWTEAIDLRAGDILVLVNGEYVVVEKVQHEILESPVTVYNFQVEDYHTYYVANGVLVHNSCTKSPEMPLDGTRMDPTEALTAAEDYLGPGYMEKSPGRFVSSDGTRQVRLTDSDLAIHNNHAGAPHMNFEFLVPNPRKPGKMRVDVNVHVFLIE